MERLSLDKIIAELLPKIARYDINRNIEGVNIVLDPTGKFAEYKEIERLEKTVKDLLYIIHQAQIMCSDFTGFCHDCDFSFKAINSVMGQTLIKLVGEPCEITNPEQ